MAAQAKLRLRLMETKRLVRLMRVMAGQTGSNSNGTVNMLFFRLKAIMAHQAEVA